MKRVGNLWPYVTTEKNIISAYKKSVTSKGHRPAIKKFNEHLADNLKAIQNLLLYGEFHTGKYTVRDIFEPKHRKIYILPFAPDRIVQHAVMNVVEPYWTSLMYAHSYSCIPKRGIHVGAQKTMEFIRRNKYCLKCDVSKFYPSIRHDVAYEMIERKIKDQKVLDIFYDVINSIDGETNVPIGNYMSQWIGNLYLTEMDNIIKQKLKVKDYIRYCDDFILFSKDSTFLMNCQEYIADYLNTRLGMRLSKCALFNLKQGVDFLGYRFFPDGYILLRKTTAKRMKKRCAHLFHLIHHRLIDADAARSSVASMLGWMKWANSNNFKVALDIYKLYDEVIAYAEEKQIREAAKAS